MLFYRIIKYSSKHNHPTHKMFWAVLNQSIYRQFDQNISFFDKTCCLHACISFCSMALGLSVNYE